jgi:hypothetical protein
VHWRELHIKEKCAERVERKKNKAKYLLSKTPCRNSNFEDWYA